MNTTLNINKAQPDGQKAAGAASGIVMFPEEELTAEQLNELMAVLDWREKYIVFKRFGLDGGKAMTLKVVGKKFGVSPERIRQLQNIALMKLRRAVRKLSQQ